MVTSALARSPFRPTVRSLIPALRQFGYREWSATVVVGIASAVMIGIPTVLIRNAWYVRMTPTRPQDYAVWLLSAVLIGLIGGTLVYNRRSDSQLSAAATGGVLSYLAVGCPVCNKLVVAALGVSGALSFFGPAQIFIGIVSLLLLLWTLLMRTDAMVGMRCSIQSPA